MRLSKAILNVAVASVFAALVLPMAGCAAKDHAHPEFATAASVEETDKKIQGQDARLKDHDGRIESLEKHPALKSRASRLATAPAGTKHTYLALPTGSEQTSLVLVEKLIPEKVSVGREFEYTILVTNLSDNVQLEGVEVTDTPDANTGYVSSEPAATTAGSTLSWKVGSLAPGKQTTIKVKASAKGPGLAGNCGTVTYVPTLCIDTLAEQPALAVRLKGPDAVKVCDTLVYEGEVKNTGTGPAKGVKVTNHIPAGLTVASGDSVVLGDIPAGETRPFKFEGKAGGPGDYTVDATVTSESVADLSSEKVKTTVCQPALKVELTGSETLYRNETDVRARYTTVVKNTAGCTVENAVLEATINGTCIVPSAASNDGKISGATITWALGTLAANAEKTVTFEGSVKELCPDGVVAKVVAKGDCAEAVSADHKTVVKGIPAILLEVTDNPDPVQVGDTTTFTVIVTNQGSAPGTNIKLKITLDGVEILETTGPTEAKTNGNIVEVAPLASLAPKESKTWTIKVKATEVGDRRTKTEMTSDQFAEPVLETESTNIYK